MNNLHPHLQPYCNSYFVNFPSFEIDAINQACFDL